MSLGLLGSYYSSSSESEDEDKNKNETTTKAEENTQPKELPKLANPFMKGASKSLKPSYMVETEDFSASKQKLSCEGAISVFNNPFRVKEDRKRAVLEHHVEMTSKQEDQTQKIGSKKVCWNFRKGRCRFGHKCTFAHDSDVASSLAAAEERAGTADANETSSNVNYSIGLLSDNKPHDPMKPMSLESNFHEDAPQLRKFDEKQMHQMFDSQSGDASSAVISNNKRKTNRPGLSDDIIPSKKARKFHDKIYGNNL